MENTLTQQVHVRFNGQSYDIDFYDLDVGIESTDVEIRNALANYLETTVVKLNNFRIDRNYSTEDITVSPQAVFGSNTIIGANLMPQIQERYEVVQLKRNKSELQDPGKTVYKIWDRELKQFGLSYYMSEKAAQKQLENKNSKKSEIFD